MNESNQVLQLAIFAGAGFGLILIGTFNLFLQRFAIGWRLAGSALLASGVGGFLWSLDLSEKHVLTSFAIMLAGFAPVILGATCIRKLLARPVLQWSLVIGIGITVVAGSTYLYDEQENRTIEADMQSIQNSFVEIPEFTTVGRYAQTDRGVYVPIHEPTLEAIRKAGERRLRTPPQSYGNAICCGQPDETSNCHGWVFTGGRFWVLGKDVDAILADNDYQRVESPKVGDLAVYRDVNGDTVIHTAIVRSVGNNQPTLVEGKWGRLGIYIHPAKECIYGSNVSFYCSPRPNHLLVGATRPFLDGQIRSTSIHED